MKKSVLPGLAIMVLLALPGIASAASAVRLSDVIDALESPFSPETAAGDGIIRDFEADFFQESRVSSLDRIQRGRGEVAVKFERHMDGRVPLTKFRWDYRQPTEQEIVSDGRNLWVYLPENRQVILSDIEATARARADDPLTFLTGLGNLSRDFIISWAMPNQDVEGNYVLELEPKRPSTMIRQLLIVVDEDAVSGNRDPLDHPFSSGEVFPILSTTVIDPQGNSTAIEFSDIRTNRSIPDSFFEFIIPAGVEVIRPTGAEMGF